MSKSRRTKKKSMVSSFFLWSYHSKVWTYFYLHSEKIRSSYCSSWQIGFGHNIWCQESQRRHEFGSVRERRNGRSGRDGQDGGRQYARSRHSGQATGSLKLKKDLASKSVDYSDMDTVREGEKGVTRKQRSKSIDQLNQQSQVLLSPSLLKFFMWSKSLDELSKIWVFCVVR